MFKHQKIFKPMLLLGVWILFLAPHSYGFFVVASNPGVEANQDAYLFYKMRQDAQQNYKELQKLADLANQINKMQQYINIGQNTLDQAKTLVNWHGNWADLNPLEIVGDIDRTSDQKLYTATSLINELRNSPQQIVDQTPILNDYIGHIDPVNWTIKKLTAKQKLLPDMVAMDQYSEYENFRNKIHGYKDSSGVIHEGKLEKLNRDLVSAKGQVATAVTDVQHQEAMNRVNQIEGQINYLLEKEKSLRERYIAARNAAEESSTIRSNVSGYQVAKEEAAAWTDKTVRVPSQKSILDELRKQENEVL